jgi:hypothetical protein
VEVEDEFAEEDFLIDWVSPPTYNNYPNKYNLLDEVSFMVYTIKIIK